MNKIQFMAMYLPHKLKVKTPNGFIANGKESTGVRGISYLTGDLFADIENKTFPGDFKPILRPISDINIEITHKGFNGNEPFNVPEWLEERYYTLDLHKQVMLLVNDTPDWVNQLDFMLVIHLIEWHFDVFGLIERNEAVDYHTLSDFVF